jgi:iron-sulfur cluster repair protein YtfE (RIC family)
MSESMRSLLNRVRRTTDELDEDSSRNEVVRYLANAYLEYHAEQQEELNQRRKRANQLAGRKDRESSESKDYDAYLGVSLQGEDNPFIGSSK